jgi:hypothetical protein
LDKSPIHLKLNLLHMANKLNSSKVLQTNNFLVFQILSQSLE